MNIAQKLENIIFNKMCTSCLKLTLLLGAFGLLLGGLVVGPLNHRPSALEIEFTDEDMVQFKEQETKNIERGLEYFRSESELWAGKKHLKEQIEKGICIPGWCKYIEDFRRFVRFKKDKEGARKGKVSSQYGRGPLSNAINRTIDENSAWNFNGGYLMKNSVLDSIGIYHWSRSPGGYSIVTAGWEKFHYCERLGIIFSIIGFLLPIGFIIGVLILYFVIFGPGVWLYRSSSRWVKWTFSEFFRD
jgi:hypothetical protein